MDQCQFNVPVYGARQLGSAAGTLLLLFDSITIAPCGSKLIFLRSSVFCFAFRMVCHLGKKINSVFSVEFCRKVDNVMCWCCVNVWGFF